jgi:triacylglycerol lipase
MRWSVTALLSKLMLVLSIAWPSPPADIAELDPVLLVHGYFLSEATWISLKGRLVDAGWPEDFVHIIEFDDVYGCNPGHAMELDAKVDEVLAATGRDKLDIVAHSMGAIDSRWWIKNLCGYQRVRDWVSLGGASHGSIVACADFMNCGAEDMCIPIGADAWKENDFLAALNDCDETAGDDIRYTSIWTEFDEIITPSKGSKLKGARNIEVDALVGHALILTSKEAAEYVMEALLGSGKNDNVPTGAGPCVQLCGDDIPEPEPEPLVEIVEPEPLLEVLEPAPEPEPEPIPEPQPEVLDEVLNEGASDGETFPDADLLSPDAQLAEHPELPESDAKQPNDVDPEGSNALDGDLDAAAEASASELEDEGSTSSSGCSLSGRPASGLALIGCLFLLAMLALRRARRSY